MLPHEGAVLPFTSTGRSFRLALDDYFYLLRAFLLNLGASLLGLEVFEQFAVVIEELVIRHGLHDSISAFSVSSQ